MLKYDISYQTYEEERLIKFSDGDTKKYWCRWAIVLMGIKTLK